MSKETSIEYADSSCNGQMGCDGCELWIPAKRIFACYAGNMTKKYAGKPGWPTQFEKPVIFPERIEEALRWSDLRGQNRPTKPWLNGLPRIIFLNDMGDTFTPSLPKEWLKPYLPKMADSPHQWLILTKNAGAMVDFEMNNPFPQNVWPGVSVTSSGKLSRLEQLRKVKSGGPKWVSYEPALERIDWGMVLGPDIDWLVSGGLSGMNRATPIESLFDAVTEGRASFVKQLGSLVHEPYYLEDEGRRGWLLDRKHKVMLPGSRGFTEWTQQANGQPAPNAVIQWEPEYKGGNMEQWPEALRIRQMPIDPVEAPAAPPSKPAPQVKGDTRERFLF